MIIDIKSYNETKFPNLVAVPEIYLYLVCKPPCPCIMVSNGIFWGFEVVFFFTLWLGRIEIFVLTRRLLQLLDPALCCLVQAPRPRAPGKIHTNT